MIHSLHGHKYLVLLISILSLLTSTLGYSVEPKCGGKLKSKFGVLVTPNFPGKFSVPISCKWIIENTPDPIGDRKKRNPGLFVNGNFDSVTMEGENLMNETKLNRSHRRPNSTKRGTSRKQVKIKTMSTSPTQSTSPMGLLNTTTMRHVSRVTPTNTSEAPSGDADVIIVYFTQLFVTSGLVIKEYAYYEDESMKYAERVIFSANDKNVMTELHVTTERPYLVIEFGLDRLETNHVRALDNLLGVYGFNMTYDVVKSRDVPTVTSCSVATCSYNGHCYASANFR
ncbi:hypothetical protein M8J76_001676 [Diaphorina citri]|nr:hypothetical protein M8J76_001676 [Diaphorina citri]KAI5754405.1 hypothetical protein M8J77_008321 [Diaphorina citri]